MDFIITLAFFTMFFNSSEPETQWVEMEEVYWVCETPEDETSENIFECVLESKNQ